MNEIKLFTTAMQNIHNLITSNESNDLKIMNSKPFLIFIICIMLLSGTINPHFSYCHNLAAFQHFQSVLSYE
jgi:hypothetical protein